MTWAGFRSPHRGLLVWRIIAITPTRVRPADPLGANSRLSHRFHRPALALVTAVLLLSGCKVSLSTPRVIYLDGAGWYSSAGSVSAGLRSGGYRGAFERFNWSSLLGVGADHFVASRSGLNARRLARRIQAIHEADPGGPLHLIGLSAGTLVVLRALEALPEEVSVDRVVLLSSSVSAGFDLSEALPHVRGRIYATCSPYDRILSSLAVSADGRTGKTVGQIGFVLPKDLLPEQKQRYQKVVNLHWNPAYAGFGWNGGHVSATNRRFVRTVITPRVLSVLPFPLDQSVVVATPPVSRKVSHGSTDVPSAAD